MLQQPVPVQKQMPPPLLYFLFQGLTSLMLRNTGRSIDSEQSVSLQIKKKRSKTGFFFFQRRANRFFYILSQRETTF